MNIREVTKLYETLYIAYKFTHTQIYIYIYNPSVYEQSVSEFPLIRDSHINSCF